MQDDTIIPNGDQLSDAPRILDYCKPPIRARKVPIWAVILAIPCMIDLIFCLVLLFDPSLGDENGMPQAMTLFVVALWLLSWPCALAGTCATLLLVRSKIKGPLLCVFIITVIVNIWTVVHGYQWG